MEVSAAVLAATLAILSPEGGSVATDRDLACAHLGRDGLGRTYLQVGLKAEASQRVLAMTQRSVGKQAEIRVCGQEHSRLKILAPVSGERLTIAKITPEEDKCLKRAISKRGWRKCAAPKPPADAPIPQ